MGIILGIRKLLRLDKKTVEFDSDVVDATGLIMPELNHFMKEPYPQCLSPINTSAKHNFDHSSPADFHQDLHL